MYEETIHDLHIKHSSTYVGVKLPDGVVLPAFVSAITLNPALTGASKYMNRSPENQPAEYAAWNLNVHVSKDEWSKTMSMTLGTEDLVLDFPHLGVFENGATACYASRIAGAEGNHKYRKTASQNNTTVKMPVYLEEKGAGIDSREQWLPKALYDAWNGPSYRSIDEAVEVLSSGARLACALSSTYIMQLSLFHNNFPISREGKHVAVYMPETGKVLMYGEALLRLKEELAELGLSVDTGNFFDTKEYQVKKSEGSCEKTQFTMDLDEFLEKYGEVFENKAKAVAPEPHWFFIDEHNA